MRRLLVGLMLVLSMYSASATADCSSQLFNPLSDTAWMWILPITVFGVELGGNGNPPMIASNPPLCICPAAYPPYYMYGVSVTYWEPLYILEVAQEPGCLVSIGQELELQALGYMDAARSSEGDQLNNRPFVHFYLYPIFDMMGSMFDMGCDGEDGAGMFGDYYFSEIDPLWNIDTLGIYQAPETMLFTNPIAQASCAVDSVAAAVWYPIDYMFWCVGGWGPMYPYTGNAMVAHSDQQLNGLVAMKFLGQQARRTLMYKTVGPSAMCSPHMFIFPVKGGYKYDPVVPIAYGGDDPIYMGETEWKWGYTGGGSGPTNIPLNQDAGVLIFQGKQCCYND